MLVGHPERANAPAASVVVAPFITRLISPAGRLARARASARQSSAKELRGSTRWTRPMRSASATSMTLPGARQEHRLAVAHECHQSFGPASSGPPPPGLEPGFSCRRRRAECRRPPRTRRRRPMRARSSPRSSGWASRPSHRRSTASERPWPTPPVRVRSALSSFRSPPETNALSPAPVEDKGAGAVRSVERLLELIHRLQRDGIAGTAAGRMVMMPSPSSNSRSTIVHSLLMVLAFSLNGE